MFDTTNIVNTICKLKETQNAKILAIIALKNNKYFFIYSYNSPVEYFSLNQLKTKLTLKIVNDNCQFIGIEMVSLITALKNGDIFIYETLANLTDNIIYDFKNTISEAKLLALLINPINKIISYYHTKLKNSDLDHDQILVYSLKLYCLLNGSNIFEIPLDRDGLINRYINENIHIYDEDKIFFKKILKNENNVFDNNANKYIEKIREFIYQKYDRVGLTFKSYSKNNDNKYIDKLFKHWVTKIFVEPTT